jgi:hypothetical protein
MFRMGVVSTRPNRSLDNLLSMPEKPPLRKADRSNSIPASFSPFICLLTRIGYPIREATYEKRNALWN